MKVNKNIGTGKNKPYNRNSLYFPDGIDSGITAGGGDAPSGGDEWQYYDVRNTTLPESQWGVMMTMFTTLVRVTDDSSTIISGTGILAMYGIEEARQRLKYIAINMDVKQYNTMTNNQLLSFKEVEAISGQSIADTLATLGITPITKEEFYDLNTELTQ